MSLEIQRAMVPSENLTIKYNEKVTDCNMRVQKLKNNLFRIQSDVSTENLDSGK